MRIRIKRVGSHALPLPSYATEGSAGMDLSANLQDVPHAVHRWHAGAKETRLAVCIHPTHHLYLPVGFAIEIPEGFEGQVRPRSGLAKKHAIVAWHPIGTVDSDYRGEVQAALHNRGTSDFWVFHGDRIAQLVVAPVVRAVLAEVEALSDTERGMGGFGSTGVAS